MHVHARLLHTCSSSLALSHPLYPLKGVIDCKVLTQGRHPPLLCARACARARARRARPEVMTVGLKAVRELCLRCPLVMNEDLLQDLAEYRKTKDKVVSGAARSLIAIFREINPAMLAKKDRGRGADLSECAALCV